MWKNASCKRQNFVHHILKKENLDHPSRYGYVQYRCSAFWPRLFCISLTWKYHIAYICSRISRNTAKHNFYKHRVNTNVGKQSVTFMAIDIWKDPPSSFKHLSVLAFPKKIKRYLLSEQKLNRLSTRLSL